MITHNGELRMSLKKHQTKKQLIITLHGIRTFAPWQKDLADELGKAGFYTKSLHYGYFSGLKLIRLGHRKKQLEWFRDQYTLIRKEYPDSVPSIIAHSFGTYIIAKALEMFNGIKFDQVILCGSIISQDFDWQALFSSKQIKRVLNECARKDIVVQAAPFFIEDAGSSGVYGFDQSDNKYLCDRFTDKFGHSDYLHRLNFTENWFPFLKGGNPPKNRPSLNNKFNWKYWLTRIVLLLLAALIVGSSILLIEKRLRIYRVHITVVDPQGIPTEEAEIRSSFIYKVTKLAAGWQIEIPIASAPKDGKFTVQASKEGDSFNGEGALVLDKELNPTIIIKLIPVKVRGRVVDSKNHGIAGVRTFVNLFGNEAVTTKEDGSFELFAHAAVGQVVNLCAEKSGYQSRRQEHPVGDHPVTILLEKNL
jgi:hypothetical protein